jgi:8-oxo-dGTP pyrophosphatase MutT (NUDIX family)
MVDHGETPVAAAKREIQEEAGVAHFTYQLLDEEPLYVNHDEETGFCFHTFVAVCPQEMAVTINKESLGFGWFNPVRLPRELHPGFQEMMQNSAVFQRIALYRDMLPAYANTRPR